MNHGKLFAALALTTDPTFYSDSLADEDWVERKEIPEQVAYSAAWHETGDFGIRMFLAEAHSTARGEGAS